MPTSPRDPAGRAVVPPPQHNLDEAAARALAAVRTQPAEQLEWLGAARRGQEWTVAVLGETLTVDLEAGTVRDSAGRAAGPWWQVLTLHYLAVTARPQAQAPTLTFADLPGGRVYASVYQQRVIERLCRTVGRDEPTLRTAAEALGGGVLGHPGAGDLAVEFAVYPHVRVQLVWYSGGGEMSPAATLLLPANIEAFFCLEDIVVLSERLVSRLAGGRF
jgi:hypothetical protein